MDKKFQRFNIVVQSNNSCFNDIENTIKGSNPKFYAYIRHEPDEEHDNDHYHIVIDFGKNKGKSYDELHDLFAGCHEEDTKDLAKSIAYLTHEDESSKLQGKHVYDRHLVKTNDWSYYSAMANSGSLETLDLTLLEMYIDQGTDSYIKFCQRFGVVACQPYMISIKEYLIHFDCMEKITTNREAIVKCNLINTIINGLYMSDHDKVLKIEELFLHGACKI